VCGVYDVWIFCEMRERSLWATNDDDDASRYVCREARDEQKKKEKKALFPRRQKHTNTIFCDASREMRETW
jgi:hypothetical protein